MFDAAVQVNREKATVYTFEVEQLEYVWTAKKSLLKSEYEISFGAKVRGDEYTTDLVGVGAPAAMTVFATVMKIISLFIMETKPRVITFQSDKQPGYSRTSLYKAMCYKYLPVGYELKIDDSKAMTLFTLTAK